MAYTVPIFNLLGDVWYAGKVPSADAPDVENIELQKYIYSRAVYDVQPCEVEQFTPPIFLRMSIDDSEAWELGQVFEVPAESGMYYRARFKEIMHQGFPNQYRVVVVVQCNDEGIPLIRNIEGAEPCESEEGVDAQGENVLGINVSPEGECTITPAGPDIEAASLEDMDLNLQPLGFSTINP